MARLRQNLEWLWCNGWQPGAAMARVRFGSLGPETEAHRLLYPGGKLEAAWSARPGPCVMRTKPR